MTAAVTAAMTAAVTAAVIALDIPSLLLLLGVFVLCITTAVTALSLPGFEWNSRRRRSSAIDEQSVLDLVDPPRNSRRVITGRPAALANIAAFPITAASIPTGAIELPAAPTASTGAVPRQIAPTPDRLLTNVDRAEALIVQLVDTDPERMAKLMTQWINSDAKPMRNGRR